MFDLFLSHFNCREIDADGTTQKQSKRGSCCGALSLAPPAPPAQTIGAVLPCSTSTSNLIRSAFSLTIMFHQSRLQIKGHMALSISNRPQLLPTTAITLRPIVPPRNRHVMKHPITAL